MLLISYDISNTKLRTQFSKFIKKHGRRLQFSVYEIKNSERILNIILLEIENNFAKRFEITDSILIVPVCEWCSKKIIRYGYAVHEEEEIVFM
ncbi:MAG TPA: CRISPR-associated endonuclease Cas2 [Candidatus Absconditabacterales bacterium]|nr:CRISPR-associated endonuclease Cas2 [Candidatus Absconditabacterales bacterium]HMT26800.1 CRISPR-associated endonuclease Cas2 [Candidatus Absconditabacterales bacterium]